MKRLSQILLEEKTIKEQNKVVAPTDREPQSSEKSDQGETKKREPHH